MSRRLILTLVCSLFLILYAPIAYADPIVNPDDVQIIATNEDKIDELEESIAVLDNDIIEYMLKMDELKIQIEASEMKVAEKEQELKAAQDEIESTREVCNQRLRLIYESGYESYFSVLLDSESFADFISRITTVKQLLEYDKTILSELRTKEEEIEAQRALLLDENNKLLAMKSELDEKISSINSAKDRQERLIESLKSKNQALRNPVVAFELPSRGASGSSDAFGYDVIEYARQFLGIRYKYGGTSPQTGFDCSGFTQYVFRNFGISLNRTSSGQAQNGVSVSRSELQPGDLIFIGFPIHHVGIYVGNDQYIHAPRTGDVIKISQLKYSKFNTGRRVRP